jgi:RHS repeat-associated protein
VVTDSSGNVSAQIGHYPYGESWYNASNDKLVFTSYERDSESGNDYALARYYISRLARFLSPDKLSGTTSNPQSLNRYSYVSNNPGNLVDPSGRCDQLLETNRSRRHVYSGVGGRELPNEEFEMLADPQDLPPMECIDLGGTGGAAGGVLEVGSISDEVVCSSMVGNPSSGGCSSSGGGIPPGVGSAGPSLDNPYFDDPSVGSGIGDNSPIHDVGTGGGGGLTPLTQKKLVKFHQAAFKALGGLLNQDCANFLSSVGIDPMALAVAIDNMVPYDGTKSTISMYDAGVYSPYETDSMAYDMFKATSISSYMSSHNGVNGRTTQALAQTPGNSVFFRPNSGITPRTIFHEALHNLEGLDDEQLAMLLGAGKNGASEDINPILQAHHCF